MSIVVAAVCIIVLTVIAIVILSRLHPPCSSLDFPDNNAYFAHIERRDRFVYEEQAAFAAINSAITVAVLARFDLIQILPAVSVICAALAVCVLLHLAFRRLPPVSVIVLAVAVGVVAGLYVPTALALGSVFGAVVIFGVCWLLLYPL